MSITFSQQIMSNGLLLVVMGGQKSNLSYRFKLELYGHNLVPKPKR